MINDVIDFHLYYYSLIIIKTNQTQTHLKSKTASSTTVQIKGQIFLAD